MKNSTFSAQVANNLLTLLQGYSKTIRLLLVMFLTLTITTNAWGADYELVSFSDIKTNEKNLLTQQCHTYGQVGRYEGLTLSRGRRGELDDLLLRAVEDELQVGTYASEGLGHQVV